MRVAFFDFDHTLLCADSNQLWIDYLHAQRLIDAAALATHAGFMRDYRAGTLDFAQLDAFRGAIEADIAATRLQSCRDDFARRHLLPAVAPGAHALLDELRRRQVLTMVVSASREALVRPAANHLGFEHVLAADSNPPGANDLPCFGAGKVLHVEAALAVLGTSLDALDRSWFYTDSHNDRPLLERVTHPVAVDPDPVLAAVARERAWPIVSLCAAA